MGLHGVAELIDAFNGGICSGIKADAVIGTADIVINGAGNADHIDAMFRQCSGTTEGAITAVIAAIMAVQQDDIKRILAYSTLSQLGYMVMAVGLLAGEAAMFHLYTHAWFKALLFLGAGAIIARCHHEQDIWKMGGLRKRMPLTVLCFMMGTCALIAIPGFSGFFSKEAILDAALAKNPIFFWVGAGVAALTTFYMLRLCIVAFMGPAREHGAEHAKEAGLQVRRSWHSLGKYQYSLMQCVLA